MDWRAGLATFLLIFFSEIGDKTQLLLMSTSARSKSPHMIFLGASAAFIASSLLAIVVGATLLKLVPLRIIRFGTGLAFLGVGAFLMAQGLRQG